MQDFYIAFLKKHLFKGTPLTWVKDDINEDLYEVNPKESDPLCKDISTVPLSNPYIEFPLQYNISVIGRKDSILQTYEKIKQIYIDSVIKTFMKDINRENIIQKNCIKYNVIGDTEESKSLFLKPSTPITEASNTDQSNIQIYIAYGIRVSGKKIQLLELYTKFQDIMVSLYKKNDFKNESFKTTHISYKVISEPNKQTFFSKIYQKIFDKKPKDIVKEPVRVNIKQDETPKTLEGLRVVPPIRQPTASRAKPSTSPSAPGTISRGNKAAEITPLPSEGYRKNPLESAYKLSAPPEDLTKYPKIAPNNVYTHTKDGVLITQHPLPIALTSQQKRFVQNKKPFADVQKPSTPSAGIRRKVMSAPQMHISGIRNVWNQPLNVTEKTARREPKPKTPTILVSPESAPQSSQVFLPKHTIPQTDTKQPDGRKEAWGLLNRVQPDNSALNLKQEKKKTKPSTLIIDILESPTKGGQKRKKKTLKKKK